MTIPRIIIRDLGDHADKKELVGIYSRFNSFKNVWVANNPPGFAYVFFDNMKDALKAVASTNGRVLCGGRVRVELTPIDESPSSNRRHSMSRRGRPSQRAINHTHLSPSPNYRQKRIRRSPEFSQGSPIPRRRRYSSPPVTSPTPKRRTSSKGYSGQHYDGDLDIPLSRERVLKKSVSSRDGPMEGRRKIERELSDHRHRALSVGDDSSSLRPSKGAYLMNKVVYRDHIVEEKAIRYDNQDYDFSPSSSPSDYSHSYEGSNRSHRMDREVFDEYPQKYSRQQSTSSTSGYENIRRIDRDTSGNRSQAHASSQSWRRRERNLGEDYYIGSSPHMSPSPPPPPPPPPPPVEHHSGSIKRGLSYHGHNKPQKDKSWDGNQIVNLDAHNFVYMPSSVSPPPPPPPPLAPPLTSPLIHPKSKRRDDRHHHGGGSHSRHHHGSESHSKRLHEDESQSKHHREDESRSRHHHGNESHSRHHRSTSQDHDKRRDKSRRHRDGSERQRHRSREDKRSNSKNQSNSPVYEKQQNHYTATTPIGAASAPSENYMYIQKEIPQDSTSPPHLKNHQYYEQIDESTEGFFSEVGYHSAQHSPQEFIQNATSGTGISTVAGTTEKAIEYIEERPASHHHHHQMYTEAYPYHSVPVPPLEGVATTYGNEVHMEQYLQIDEVEGNGDRAENFLREQGGHDSYRHQEREVFITSSSVAAALQEQEREVVHRKHEKDREVHRKHDKEREVVHRKHEREVIVKRSPERNRSHSKHSNVG